MSDPTCPFCQPIPEAVFFADDLVLGLWDAFPVSPGHALIVPRRHVGDWFTAERHEQAAIVGAINAVKQEIEKSYRPDGYNIGVNIGAAAGQTVFHLHLHVIPRFAGDVADPRGGLRHVLPHAANYGTLPSAASPEWIGQVPHGRAVITGGDGDPLLPHLVGHLDRATDVDIAVAFTMDSGVRLLQPYLEDVLARGGRLRLLTGDYLGVSDPDALLRLTDLIGNVQLRVFESAGMSFHPKTYIAHQGAQGGIAFVGSSNLSATALKEGIEWNYRVVPSRDQAGFGEVLAGFDALFAHPNVRPLDAAWVEAYRKRRAPSAVIPAGVRPEGPPVIPVPHEVQREALGALERIRAQGAAAGLVVLATGLGKTWLGAFDSARGEFARILFVAHREEILGQAMKTFRAIRPSARLGLYTGTEKVPDADVLFASVQTLSKIDHLNRFDPHHFDYIIVDEFHHAAARTYRRLIGHFQPKFLLGLTATPERTDGGDLLALCGETLIYRCDLVEGIRRGLLSPFAYFGVPDVVNYENIPWRSTRFDEEELTRAVATQERAENAWEQFRARAGTRTLAFCVSQIHANFMAEFFRQKGLRAVAVHTGDQSAPRAHSLEQLNAGELDVLFAVDMFNEGVDLPQVDTVMMLRPTESEILWLQQFGRGLRWLPGKQLKVIDYIGNHRSFLVKPRTLLQLGVGDGEISYALQSLEAGTFELPPGCSVTYDLEAKDILLKMLRRSPPGERLRAYYLEYRGIHGIRPTAVEAYHDGFDPKAARPNHASWLSFVRAMGDFSSEQGDVHQRLGQFLEILETTPMTKSFKMVVLLAMLMEDALPGTIGVQRLEERVIEVARRYALVRTEFGSALGDRAELRKLLEENPIKAWTEGRGTGEVSYFTYDGLNLSTAFTIEPALREALRDLVRELVEWRLAVYLRRVGIGGGAERIIGRVSRAGERLMLFLPDRGKMAGIPEGWVAITIGDKDYQANFAKIAVNVLEEVGGDTNVLSDVLREWFGPGAGLPGTTQAVEFTRSGEGYSLAPISGELPQGPRLWASYVRANVPKLFGFEFRGREGQSGVVERDKLTLLFVTLDKTSQPDTQKYDDAFVSPAEFRWQSQNRTSRDSEPGRRLADHEARGIGVHLFVRPVAKRSGETQPFVYCGPLRFMRWEGDNPITIWWRLNTEVPVELREGLRVAVDGRAV